MATAQSAFPTVVRTERGLSVAGSRLTIYLLMDHFKAGWPATLVQQAFNLTDEQIADVVGYIEAHREEVEGEYEEVLRHAAEIRCYWEERNREQMRKADESPKTPQQLAIRARLEELREKLRSRK